MFTAALFTTAGGGGNPSVRQHMTGQGNVACCAVLSVSACEPMGPSPPGSSVQGVLNWTGLLCPPPGSLPNPGIEPTSLALQEDALLFEPPGKPQRGN